MMADDALGRPALDRLHDDDLRPGQRIVLRGGVVLTMDDTLGDFGSGDVVFADGRIVEVGASRPGVAYGNDDIVIDAGGCIVMPGLQDTHRHCWQTQLRRMFANVDLMSYVDAAHAQFAPAYRPEDIYVGGILAGIGSLHNGVTSLLDFAHNSRTVDHAAAAVRGLDDSGIRARVAIAPPLRGQWDDDWPQNIDRVRAVASSERISFAYGVFGTSELGPESIALTVPNARTAAEYGLPLVADATFGESASVNIVALHADGLLGPNVTLIHGTALTEAAWSAIAQSRAKLSLTTTSDAELGTFGGVPPISRAVAAGVRPGLSVDVECSLSSDFFTQMRATYSIQRMLLHSQGGDPASLLSPKDIVRMATIDGAYVNGVGDIAGSLVPGKQADVIVLDVSGPLSMPLNSAYSEVVLGCDSSNVRDVFVGGMPKKLAGHLIDVDLAELGRRAAASRDYLVGTSGYAAALFQ